MPINVTENLYNITSYLEKSNFTDYVSNPFYMAMFNSLCLFIMILVIGQEMTVGLVFFVLIYSCILFFTFSYAYKKSVKPKETPILQPGLSSITENMQGPVPRITPMPVLPQNSSTSTNVESI